MLYKKTKIIILKYIMEFLVEKTIIMTPLALIIYILAAIALGWSLYSLRGVRHWVNRLNRYSMMGVRQQPGYGYVEYIPEVTRPLRQQRVRELVKAEQIPAPTPKPVRTPSPSFLPQQEESSAPAVAKIPEVIEPKVSYSTKDDLRVVEGIGPKIEEVLNNNGIHTWRELAATPVHNLDSILGRAGKRFQMHDPQTWPKQARFADAGKWDELREYQDLLLGGQE